jgi:hypothetical protein
VVDSDLESIACKTTTSKPLCDDSDYEEPPPKRNRRRVTLESEVVNSDLESIACKATTPSKPLCDDSDYEEPPPKRNRRRVTLESEVVNSDLESIADQLTTTTPSKPLCDDSDYEEPPPKRKRRRVTLDSEVVDSDLESIVKDQLTTTTPSKPLCDDSDIEEPHDVPPPRKRKFAKWKRRRVMLESSEDEGDVPHAEASDGIAMEAESRASKDSSAVQRRPDVPGEGAVTLDSDDGSDDQVEIVVESAKRKNLYRQVLVQIQGLLLGRRFGSILKITPS